MDECGRHDAEGKKANTKDHVVYDSTHILYEMSRSGKSREAESRLVVGSGSGQRWRGCGGCKAEG